MDGNGNSKGALASSLEVLAGSSKYKLCFLIQDADCQEVKKVNLAIEPAFQSEVENFLDDSSFTAATGTLAYVRACHPSKISNLGVVAIKSSGGMRISTGIWVRKTDSRALRYIMPQTVLQVFGEKAMHLGGEVGKTTQIEVHLCCFIKNEESRTVEKLQDDMDIIDINILFAVPEQQVNELLENAYRSRNLKLIGEKIQDFVEYAKVMLCLPKNKSPNKQLIEGASQGRKGIEDNDSVAGYPKSSQSLSSSCQAAVGSTGNAIGGAFVTATAATDNLSFLIRDAKDLCEFDIVKESGFQSEVQNFLYDPDFPWTCLAGIRKPDYQKSENYGIFGSDSKILGLVAIKSSDGTVMPMRISAGIWLRQKDVRVLRRIKAQIILQVFGASPMNKNKDIRRNRWSLTGIDSKSWIETEMCCVFGDELTENEEEVSINLKVALGRDGLPLRQQFCVSSNLNLKLTGQEEDFVDFADIVSGRLKQRPDKPFKAVKNFDGCWVPGNLFKFTLSEHLSEALKNSQWRKEFDGHTVVLLPSSDITGILPLNEKEEVLVAPVDTRKRSIYLVPKITLHPISTDGKQMEPGKQKPKELTKYLEGKHKYQVLVNSGIYYKKARLCLEVVGGDCMVEFEDEGHHAKPRAVDASSLRCAADLQKNFGKLQNGQEARTIADSGHESVSIEIAKVGPLEVGKNV